ncbi:uncharacterized protein F5Z01DRAFT_672107 [Emericellopsis atlantica]|uniref:Uncharacterized protein n=1 Tax=Emericellopsis atlantica TaxID=2614577 RepID=A0A9P7ZSK1_9HYPO|nr:uncharacterized protein F5Z01DRAFT_672107 [Emericellopsis atlantica]KAG9256878.1 hypothetical protein F5Z01DRAFT_672107 [Emericellopsis atlantica]
MTGNKPQKDDAWARASEFSAAMLDCQPYADDSMLFIMRYSTIRAQDFSAMMSTLDKMTKLWGTPAAEVPGGPEARAQKAAEYREECMRCLGGFPELQTDFDRFVTSSRAMARAANGGQV